MQIRNATLNGPVPGYWIDLGFEYTAAEIALGAGNTELESLEVTVTETWNIKIEANCYCVGTNVAFAVGQFLLYRDATQLVFTYGTGYPLLIATTASLTWVDKAVAPGNYTYYFYGKSTVDDARAGERCLALSYRKA